MRDMLRAAKSKLLKAGEARFAIVASQYNSRYLDAMLHAAKAELKRAGAKQIQVIRLPGAYEVPVVVARLARKFTYHASSITHLPRRSETQAAHLSPFLIICLGAIL